MQTSVILTREDIGKSILYSVVRELRLIVRREGLPGDRLHTHMNARVILCAINRREHKKTVPGLLNDYVPPTHTILNLKLLISLLVHLIHMSREVSGVE